MNFTECNNDGNITCKKKAYGITNKANVIMDCMNTGFLNATCGVYGIADKYVLMENTESTGGNETGCYDPPTKCHLNDGHCNVYGQCTYGRIPGYEEESYCYEAICEDIKWRIQKRANASAWEDQSNDCETFMCSNESGPIVTSNCNDWSVEVELGEEFEKDYTEKIINTILGNTGLKSDEVGIGMQTNGNGGVVRIYIYVSDNKVANDVLSTINKMNDQCIMDMCKLRTVKIKSLKEGLSGIPSNHDNFFSIIIIFMSIVVSIATIF